MLVTEERYSRGIVVQYNYSFIETNQGSRGYFNLGLMNITELDDFYHCSQVLEYVQQMRSTYSTPAMKINKQLSTLPPRQSFSY